jgi:hypothetical protein
MFTQMDSPAPRRWRLSQQPIPATAGPSAGMGDIRLTPATLPSVTERYTIVGCKVMGETTLHTLTVPSGQVLRQGWRSP